MGAGLGRGVSGWAEAGLGRAVREHACAGVGVRVWAAAGRRGRGVSGLGWDAGLV